jgi:hypothetical protein
MEAALVMHGAVEEGESLCFIHYAVFVEILYNDVAKEGQYRLETYLAQNIPQRKALRCF